MAATSKRSAAKSAASAEKVDKRLYWTPTLQVRAGLERIEHRGLYGDTLSHVVNHIVTKEITELLRLKLLSEGELTVAREQAQKSFEATTGRSREESGD